MLLGDMISAKCQVSKDMNSSRNKLHIFLGILNIDDFKGMMTPLLSYKFHPFIIGDFSRISELITNVAYKPNRYML